MINLLALRRRRTMRTMTTTTAITMTTTITTITITNKVRTITRTITTTRVCSQYSANMSILYLLDKGLINIKDCADSYFYGSLLLGQT